MAAIMPKQRTGRCQQQRIVRLDAEQQRRNAAARQQSQPKTSHDADENQLPCLAHDQAEHVHTPRAERDAHADLRPPLRDQYDNIPYRPTTVSDDREHAEKSCEHRQQPLADEPVPNARLEHRKFGDRIRVPASNVISDSPNGHGRRDARVNHHAGTRPWRGMLRIGAKHHRRRSPRRSLYCVSGMTPTISYSVDG